jgi:formylmethanofuran dehydrogenase subunit E
LPQVAKNYDTIAEYWHAQYLDKIKKKSRARYEKARDAAGFTPQTGRMLKLVCPECHRIIRLSHKSLEAGEIVCFPCNRSFSPAEG